MEAVYRFLLTPRWWAINLFVALAVPFCLVAGCWQLDRFQDRVDRHREQQRQATSQEAPRPLAELLPLTTETVGEQATARGRYDAGHQLLVPNRTLDGEPGFYVLTPLLPEDGGPALPVVRGWLPGDADPASVPAPPEGTVTVSGALQAAESPSKVPGPTSGLPAGQLGVIGAASLINLLPYEVLDTWLTVREAEPPMRAVPPTVPEGTGLDARAFQNLGYTAEWFVFAGFTVFMWYRLLRREAEAQRDAALGLDPRPAPDAARPSPDAGVRSRSPAPPA